MPGRPGRTHRGRRLATTLAALALTASLPAQPEHPGPLTFADGPKTFTFNGVALEQAVSELGQAAGRELILASRWCAGFTVSQSITAESLPPALDQLLGGMPYTLRLGQEGLEVHVPLPDTSHFDRHAGKSLELLRVEGEPGVTPTTIFRPESPLARPTSVAVLPAVKPRPDVAAPAPTHPIAPGVTSPVGRPANPDLSSDTNRPPVARPGVGMPITTLPFALP